MSRFEERATGKIVDAYAEWDDPHGYCVYLVREDEEGEPDLDHSQRMMPVILGDSVEARLYKACFVTHPRDHGGDHPAAGEPVRWKTRPPAERAAKAVLKELKAIAEGKPGPSDFAIQFAIIKAKNARKGRHS